MLQVDPYSLRFMASRFAAAADEIKRKASRMEEITLATTGGSSGWKGQAANQFVHRNEFLATELRDSVKQFEEIVVALQTLASRVEMIQSKEQRLHQLQQARSQLQWGLDVSRDAEIAALNTQIYMLEAEITADKLYADTAAAVSFQAVKFQESFHEIWQQVQQVATTTVAKADAVVQDMLDQAEQARDEKPGPIKEAVEELEQFAEGFAATYLENLAMGFADPLHEDFPEKRSKVYQAGRLVGDLAAAVQGGVEMNSGATLDVFGVSEAVLTSPTGALPLIGVAAVAVGTMMAAHGWEEFEGASKDLDKEWLLLQKEEPASGGIASEPKAPTETVEKVEYGDHYTKDGRKTVLKPNVEYTSPEGYTYRTDSKGRIASVEGKLSLGKEKRNRYAQTKTGHSGDAGDEGGHLVASIFKGSGDIDNLVPMNGNLNKGEWKKLENMWKKALEQRKTVEFKMNPIFKDDSPRPDRFEIDYKLDSGDWVFVEFQNSPGGK